MISTDHVNFPHPPGTLYDCPACEDNHYHPGDIHCALRDEELTEQFWLDYHAARQRSKDLSPYLAAAEAARQAR